MSRNEIVRLVSRALAVMQFISALYETTFLPERIYSAHHYVSAEHLLGRTFIETLEQFYAAFVFARIAMFLILAWIFWQCGPRIARLLLPPDDSSIQSNAGPEPGPEDPALF
ncbi:MAG TPA: hypothetical protein VG267_18400 [Terracidiphilus sp.]|jgi:hypothetical protein|nr:hypothetical protein [Terracidiphilus sp.]